MKIRIRKGTIQDASALGKIEADCFDENEAASPEEIADRLRVYGSHFLILEKDEKPIGFIDGFVTDEKDLNDEMYRKAGLHNPDGRWQMIFGLNVLPSERRQGYGGMLIKAMIKLAESENRSGVVLTCRERLVHYYSSFGFESEGISQSNHGGGIWIQMRYTF